MQFSLANALAALYSQGQKAVPWPKSDERRRSPIPVDFPWMIPITEVEQEYAVEFGSDALERKFEEVNLSPVVDESRESIV
ncbi:MAG: suppressor of fused domain protein [Pirellulales bacterium]|nr:suppressor of fused domain protein [Pirellulales bacterium]